MARGLEVFRQYFGEHLDRYVVIGGTACNLIYAQYGLEERATQDIDMIIVAEAFDREFYELFRSFVVDGGYQHRSKVGKHQLYRFDKPSDAHFPMQVELLSRRPEYLEGIEAHLGRFTTVDAAGSLSAIILGDEYYALLEEGIEVLDGLPILAHKYLPVFKVHAWINLTADKKAGKNVHGDEIRKHCRDVLRLCSLFAPGTRFELPESIAAEVAHFTEIRPWDDNLLRNIGLDMAADEMVHHIESIYCS